MLDHPLLLIFPLAMAFAGAMDLLTMTIPNRICTVLVASFFLAAATTGVGWSVVGVHVLMGVAVLIVSIILFANGVLGGGDAKLIAAAALWLGPDQFLPYAFLVTLFGGILALAMLKYRSLDLLPGWLAKQRWALRLHEQKCGLPYGIALGAAGLITFTDTIWFASLTHVA
jgi:prepilin peptidase CpaA